MVSPQEEPTSSVLIAFIRCPECQRHPVRFAGERDDTIELTCQHCHHEWSRPTRRIVADRRQRSTRFSQERRTGARRAGKARPVVPPVNELRDLPDPPRQSLEIRGEVFVSDDYVLDGHVRGSVSVPAHTLTVAASGDAVADLSARVVIVHGAVLGNITATERITLVSGARVRGNLSSAALTCEDGAEFTGRVERT